MYGIERRLLSGIGTLQRYFLFPGAGSDQPIKVVDLVQLQPFCHHPHRWITWLSLRQIDTLINVLAPESIHQTSEVKFQET